MASPSRTVPAAVPITETNNIIILQVRVPAANKIILCKITDTIFTLLLQKSYIFKQVYQAKVSLRYVNECVLFLLDMSYVRLTDTTVIIILFFTSLYP